MASDAKGLSTCIPHPGGNGQELRGNGARRTSFGEVLNTQCAKLGFKIKHTILSRAVRDGNQVIDQLPCTILETNPLVQLRMVCMSHGKSINPIERKVSRLRGMPLRKGHQQGMMMRSTNAKVPLELSVRERLHASVLNLRLSNQNVVNARGMSTMSKCVLITPFTVNGNQVLRSQNLLQDMAVLVHIG